MLKSFVSGNRRAALENYFRQYFGTFANVEVDRIRALANEAKATGSEAGEVKVDEEFESIERSVRYVLVQLHGKAAAAHQAILAELTPTFEAVRAAYGGNVPRKIEDIHFAKAAPLYKALTEAKRNLDAFEADVGDLKKTEAKLLEKTGGVRPVRKAAVEGERKSA